MIKVYYEKYWCDYHRKNETENFPNLETVADWIFGQMRQGYSHMSFPREDKFISPDRIPWAIEFSPEYTGPSIWIHMMEQDGQIIFSDSRLTNGQSHWSKNVKEWCKECIERQKMPKFNFAD